MQFAFEDPRIPSRFWANVQVDEASGCWEWTGCRNDAGYGTQYAKGLPRLTHRATYSALAGPIQDGLYVDHMCRNRACCNPQHLRTVTPRINAIENSVSIPAMNHAKTHCHNGHAYTAETMTLERSGDQTYRRCKACVKIQDSYGTATGTRKTYEFANHGTSAAYRFGCRCRECKDQQRDRMRIYRAERAARAARV